MDNKAIAYLKTKGMEDRIREFDVSTATVELAAQALGCEPAHIAKTLSFAAENGCKTVDFPSISTGVYHFPLDRAAKIAISTIIAVTAAHPEIERVRMVCFDSRTKQAYENALREVRG